MTTIPTENIPWWEDFFDPTVASIILKGLRPNETAFLEEHLELTQAQSLFCQCCGWGRVAGPLKRKGYDVWGVDASLSLIEASHERWDLEPSQVVCADAKDFTNPILCDAGVNLYSSFGYTNDDKQNQLILENSLPHLNPEQNSSWTRSIRVESKRIS